MYFLNPLTLLNALSVGQALALPQAPRVAPAASGPPPVAIAASSGTLGALADQVQVVVFTFGSCTTDAPRMTYSLFHGSSGCVPVSNRGSITHVPSTGTASSYCNVRIWSGSNCQGSSDIVDADECRSVPYAAFSYECF